MFLKLFILGGGDDEDLILQIQRQPICALVLKLFFGFIDTVGSSAIGIAGLAVNLVYDHLEAVDDWGKTLLHVISTLQAEFKQRENSPYRRLEPDRKPESSHGCR